MLESRNSEVLRPITVLKSGSDKEDGLKYTRNLGRTGSVRNLTSPMDCMSYERHPSVELGAARNPVETNASTPRKRSSFAFSSFT